MKNTLFQKTLVGQIALFALVAVTTSVSSAWNLQERLSEEYRSKGKAIATSVASSSEQIVGTSPAENTQALIDQFLEIRGVGYAMVVDASGEIIAHTFVPQVPVQLRNFKEEATQTEELVIREIQIEDMGDYINISAPILAGVGGYVRVGMDKGPIAAQIREGVVRELSLIFLLFVTSAIATYIMVKKISQPLTQLTKYAERLAVKDFSAPVDIRSDDEIGLLATTMRSMASDLGSFVEQLETAVANATGEQQKTLEALRLEQARSEELLLNMLPAPIAKQLIEGDRQIAEGFAEVTILFADIVGFTKLSQEIPPIQLINWLNELFSGFDGLSEEHGLEKIKTIGDAYLVVGGIPIERPDHAEAVADMALDMLRELDRFNAKHDADLRLRIGINTGPVVAGVVGTKKFIYDLWGDAVNTASRMESHGIPDEIQVTEHTYGILKEKYILKERGAIEVKGKGEMTTYLLVGKKKDVK